MFGAPIILATDEAMAAMETIMEKWIEAEIHQTARRTCAEIARKPISSVRSPLRGNNKRNPTNFAPQ
jgi:hypothetical protein